MKTTVKRGLVLRYLIHGLFLSEEKIARLWPQPTEWIHGWDPEESVDAKGKNLNHGTREKGRTEPTKAEMGWQGWGTA